MNPQMPNGNPEIKISRAFEQYLSECGPNDKRDAIVIFRTPETKRTRVRGRMGALKERLNLVKDRAAANGPLQMRVLEQYQKAGCKQLPGKQQLDVSSIGENTLPVATVEVTRKSLRALAEQPQVVAILPDQRIHLIKPKEVEYKELQKKENRDGLTWGLKKLGISKLWETTKGEHVSVCVLDTGVYAEHEALKGRVKDFVVIDPLGRRIKAVPAFDCESHGTHVCGTIAGGKTSQGVAIGVAPGPTCWLLQCSSVRLHSEHCWKGLAGPLKRART